MGWSEVDWKQARPDNKAIEDALKTLVINEEKIDDSTIIEYIGSLKSRLNVGEVVFNSYQVRSNPVIDWFAQRNRFDEIYFFKYFINHPNVLRSLPGDFARNHIDRKTFTFSNDRSYTLDGLLTVAIIYGGPDKFQGNARIVKELADKVCFTIFGYRYEDILVFQANTNCNPDSGNWSPGNGNWTPWFYGLIWDTSLIIVDKKTTKVWVIFSTDND